MKPVVAFIVTFVVSAAASTGAKVMTAKPAAPHAAAKADSTKTDSTTASDSTRADSAATPVTQIAAQPTDTTRRAPITASDSSKATAPASAKGAPVVAQAPAKPASDTAGERRLSKVFTSMEPKQAAKVLDHMSDNDVHVILGYVGPRQAAAIMAELPPERVAKLSKLAMTAGSGGNR